MQIKWKEFKVKVIFEELIMNEWYKLLEDFSVYSDYIYII